MAIPDPVLAPTADFVTSTLNGALATGATSATIGTGLDLPATNGILQIDYDSTTAVGVDEGPETISYTSYTSGTGALAGLTRGIAGTTDVAHDNGSTVQAGMSAAHYGNGVIKNADLDTAAGGIGAAWKSWTPTFTSLTGGTLNYSEYIQVGKTIHFRLKYTLGGAGVSGAISFTVPVAFHADYASSNAEPIGTAIFRDANGNINTGSATWFTGGKIATLVHQADGTYNFLAVTSSAVPFTWASTDILMVTGTYEAA